MTRWLWLLALASCDQIYGLTGRGEDASVADVAPSDSPVADASPLECEPSPEPLADYDRDGILNQNDACPEVFDRGYNEDGDCFGDLCDACPQDESVVQDFDNDRVGDPCDLAGPSADVWRMDGFGDVDEILPLVAGWTHDASSGTLSSTTPAGAGRYAWTNTEHDEPFLIETQFRIPPGATMWTAGIVFGASGLRDQTPDGWMLAITRLGPVGAELRLMELVNGVPTNLNMDQPVMLEDPQRLRLQLVGKTLSITAGRRQNVTTTTFELSSGVPSASGFGIGVMGAESVTFDYLYEVHHR